MGKIALLKILQQDRLLFCLAESVNDSKNYRSTDDGRNLNDAHWKLEFLEVGGDFVIAAVFAKLLTAVQKFDAHHIARPLVVERTEFPVSMSHPER